MYIYISETNQPSQPIPLQGNVTAFTSALQYTGRIRFRGISVKHVIEGEEKYFINGQKIVLKKNQYLLANHLSEGFVHIDSKQSVVGICADVGLDTIIAVVKEEYSFYSDRIIQSIEKLIHSLDYPIFTRGMEGSNVGLFLKRCVFQLKADPFSERLLSNEFYFDLGSAIIQDHICDEWPSLRNRKRMNIRQEEIKLLCEAKNYMDQNFTSSFLVKDVALMYGMSEYRFFRMFKQVFDESPYRYLLLKRLWYSCFLLHRNKVNVTQAAFESGFADIHSFSKAYKKHFSSSPNQHKILID